MPRRTRSTSRFVAILLWLLVAWEARVRPEYVPAPGSTDDADGGRRPGDRFLVPRPSSSGWRIGNHSLTLLLAPARRPVRHRRRPVHLAPPAARPRLRRGARGHTRRRLPRAAAARRDLRAPLVYGRPETWDGFWYVSLGRAVPGQPRHPFGELPRQVRRARRADGGPVRDPRAGRSRLRSSRPPCGGRVRAADRFGRPHHVLLRGLVRQRRHRPLLPRADPDRLDLAGDPRRRPRSTSWRVATGEPLAELGPRRPRAGRVARSRSGSGPGWPRWAWRSSSSRRGLALRDRFAFVDESQRHRAPRVFVDHVAQTLEPGRVIVSWWSYSTPLWYAQLVEGQRPDVAIVDDRTRLDENLGDVTDVIDANLGKRPVYVIRLRPRRDRDAGRSLRPRRTSTAPTHRC